MAPQLTVAVRTVRSVVAMTARLGVRGAVSLSALVFDLPHGVAHGLGGPVAATAHEISEALRHRPARR
jgi:hypothetical protein